MPEGPSPAREISASITTLLVYTFAHSIRQKYSRLSAVFLLPDIPLGANPTTATFKSY